MDSLLNGGVVGVWSFAAKGPADLLAGETNGQSWAVVDALGTDVTAELTKPGLIGAWLEVNNPSAPGHDEAGYREIRGIFVNPPNPYGVATAAIGWAPPAPVLSDGSTATVRFDVAPLPTMPRTLDDLTDVDVSLSATGMMLTKQLDGSWKGANFTRPLNWLTDVAAPADAEGVLGTTGPGQWEPLPMDHLQQQIVGPLPAQVAALDQRIAALEVTPEPAPVDHALTVDNYAGGFTRIVGAQVIGTDPVRITVALATTPGVNGTVFPDLSAISGSANVWADFAGALGRVEDALTGTPIHGAALKEVIRRGTVVICHRDNTDPAHPTLKIDGTEAAGQPGTSLTLASLADVDNAAATAPAGQVLGTTGVGEWGPVSAILADPEGNTLPWSASTRYFPGNPAVGADGYLYTSDIIQTGGTAPSLSNLATWTVVSGTSTGPAGVDALTTLSGVLGVPAVPSWWEARSYIVNTMVRHRKPSGVYGVYVASGPASAGQVPGVDPVWEPYDLVSLAAREPAGVWKSWTGTQSAYDALAVKDPATLYVITP
jgi:hypothetical protein